MLAEVLFPLFTAVCAKRHRINKCMLKNQRKNGRKEGGEGGREREIPNLVPHSNDILDSHEAVSMC